MTHPSIHSFINVFHEELGSDWSELLEAAYLRRFFKSLRELMGESFEQLRFLIINKNSRWSRIAPPIRGEDVVLIWLGDEEGTIPHELAREFRLILKSYWPLSEPLGNMHPFALWVDFYRQFIPWGRFPPAKLPLIVRKLIARGLATSFGRLLTRDFSSSFPKSAIRFTGGFAQGYPPGEFASRLADARIAICPPGFTSPETIRHFEAMSMGCVVISAPLPRNLFYRGSPVIELENWQLLHPFILNLLEMPEKMESISRQTKIWWNEYCSPEAMAKKTVPLLGR